MDKIKKIGNILFWITVFLVPISYFVTTLVGDVKYFSIAGVVIYSWIMLLFIPIAVSCFIVGIILKRKGESFKKNYIAAIISIILLLIFGMFWLIFSDDYTTDTKIVVDAEKIVGISLSNDIKVVNEKCDGYTVCYVKVLNDEKNGMIKNEIEKSDKWTKELHYSVTRALIPNHELELTNFEYFLFYNKTTREYNVNPIENSKYNCLLVGYDAEMGRIIIISDIYY